MRSKIEDRMKVQVAGCRVGLVGAGCREGDRT